MTLNTALSLKNVTAWEALDGIAQAAGMHGAGMQHLDGAGDSILLTRDVKSAQDMGLTPALMQSPLYAQLSRVKMPAMNFDGPLSGAAAAFADEVKRVPGNQIQFSIRVDPGIAGDPVQFSSEGGWGAGSLVMISGVGKYELRLQAPDQIRVRAGLAKRRIEDP